MKTFKQKPRFTRPFTLALATSALISTSMSLQAATVTFDENALAPSSFFHPLVSSTFSSGGVDFGYVFNDFGDFGDGPCCWNGFPY